MDLNEKAPAPSLMSEDDPVPVSSTTNPFESPETKNHAAAGGGDGDGGSIDHHPIRSDFPDVDMDKNMDIADVDNIDGTFDANAFQSADDDISYDDESVSANSQASSVTATSFQLPPPSTSFPNVDDDMDDGNVNVNLTASNAFEDVPEETYIDPHQRREKKPSPPSSHAGAFEDVPLDVYQSEEGNGNGHHKGKGDVGIAGVELEDAFDGIPDHAYPTLEQEHPDGEDNDEDMKDDRPELDSVSSALPNETILQKDHDPNTDPNNDTSTSTTSAFDAIPDETYDEMNRKDPTVAAFEDVPETAYSDDTEDPKAHPLPSDAFEDVPDVAYQGEEKHHGDKDDFVEEQDDSEKNSNPVQEVEAAPVPLQYPEEHDSIPSQDHEEEEIMDAVDPICEEVELERNGNGDGDGDGDMKKVPDHEKDIVTESVDVDALPASVVDHDGDPEEDHGELHVDDGEDDDDFGAFAFEDVPVEDHSEPQDDAEVDDDDDDFGAFEDVTEDHPTPDTALNVATGEAMGVPTGDDGDGEDFGAVEDVADNSAPVDTMNDCGGVNVDVDVDDDGDGADESNSKPLTEMDHVATSTDGDDDFGSFEKETQVPNDALGVSESIGNQETKGAKDDHDDDDNNFGAFEDVPDGAFEDVPPQNDAIPMESNVGAIDDDDDDDFGAFENVPATGTTEVSQKTVVANIPNDSEDGDDGDGDGDGDDDGSFGDFEDVPESCDNRENDLEPQQSSAEDEEFGDFGDFEESTQDDATGQDIATSQNPFVAKASSVFHNIFQYRETPSGGDEDCIPEVSAASIPEILATLKESAEFGGWSLQLPDSRKVHLEQLFDHTTMKETPSNVFVDEQCPIQCHERFDTDILGTAFNFEQNSAPNEIYNVVNLDLPALPDSSPPIIQPTKLSGEESTSGKVPDLKPLSWQSSPSLSESSDLASASDHSSNVGINKETVPVENVERSELPAATMVQIPEKKKNPVPESEGFGAFNNSEPTPTHIVGLYPASQASASNETTADPFINNASAGTEANHGDIFSAFDNAFETIQSTSSSSFQPFNDNLDASDPETEDVGNNTSLKHSINEYKSDDESFGDFEAFQESEEAVFPPEEEEDRPPMPTTAPMDPKEEEDRPPMPTTAPMDPVNVDPDVSQSGLIIEETNAPLTISALRSNGDNFGDFESFQEPEETATLSKGDDEAADDIIPATFATDSVVGGLPVEQETEDPRTIPPVMNSIDENFGDPEEDAISPAGGGGSVQDIPDPLTYPTEEPNGPHTISVAKSNDESFGDDFETFQEAGEGAYIPDEKRVASVHSNISMPQIVESAANKLDVSRVFNEEVVMEDSTPISTRELPWKPLDASEATKVPASVSDIEGVNSISIAKDETTDYQMFDASNGAVNASSMPLSASNANQSDDESFGDFEEFQGSEEQLFSTFENNLIISPSCNTVAQAQTLSNLIPDVSEKKEPDLIREKSKFPLPSVAIDAVSKSSDLPSKTFVNVMQSPTSNDKQMGTGCDDVFNISAVQGQPAFQQGLVNVLPDPFVAVQAETITHVHQSSLTGHLNPQMSLRQQEKGMNPTMLPTSSTSSNVGMESRLRAEHPHQESFEFGVGTVGIMHGGSQKLSMTAFYT